MTLCCSVLSVLLCLLCLLSAAVSAVCLCSVCCLLLSVSDIQKISLWSVSVALLPSSCMYGGVVWWYPSCEKVNLYKFHFNIICSHVELNFLSDQRR